MPEHTIHLIGGRDEETGSVAYGPDDGECKVRFCYRDRVIEATSSDYFSAFALVRLELEKEGLIPFCYGASLNVSPTPETLEEDAGLTVYRLPPDRDPEESDLAGIFDTGADVIPSTVENQREFFSRWLEAYEDQ